MELRNYQKKIVKESINILKSHRFVYLAMEVRTGKTITSLSIAEELGVESVLFLTKKKAISSISKDYGMLCPNSFNLITINYESIHKIPNIKWGMIILDEAHGLGAFPKPSKRAKQVSTIIKKNNPYVCLLSGTPTPESYSQMYHQVYGIPGNPFFMYTNFYRFADEHVNKVQKKINGFNLNDYSDGRQSINDAMRKYMVSYTQKQAGFESEIEEEILTVSVDTAGICNKLKRDLVVEMEDDEVILADTGVKLMSKLHQMYSGTVKFESGKSVVLDTSKAEFIKWRFDGQKIGVFYKFKAELDALKMVFGLDLCTDLDVFDSTDCKVIALQIVSGREGISLRNAEHIVFYNIDFSATSYWQARDRMTTKDRKYNKVYWIFSDKGIEKNIYKTVVQKKDYTLRHFKQYYI